MRPRQNPARRLVIPLLALLGPAAFPSGALAQRLPAYPSFARVPKGSYAVLQMGEKGPTRARLQKPIRVAGVPWQEDLDIIWEWNRAVIHKGTLSRDFKHGPVTYQAGRPLHFAYDGKRVLRGFLAGDQTVLGVPLRGGTEVAFHEGGQLWKGTLASDHVVAGVRCKAGGPLWLSRQGRAYHCVLASDQRFGGLPVAGDKPFQLFDRGKPVARFVLATEHRIGPVAFKAYEPLVYDNAQELDVPDLTRLKLRSGVLARDTVLGKVPCAGGQGAAFHGSADRLASCTLARPFEVAPGMAPKAGSVLYLDPSGRVSRFTLVEKQIFHNTEYPAGHDVHLDTAGKVVKVTRPVATPGR